MEDNFAEMIRIYSYLFGIDSDSPDYGKFLSACFDFYKDNDRDKFHEALEKLKENRDV